MTWMYINDIQNWALGKLSKYKALPIYLVLHTFKLELALVKLVESGLGVLYNLC